ncbi:Type IV secretion system protein virB10 (plasmid) [Variovorax sp. SRS16]|uniref:TrbI/VirB10 family protein n=1 Tax=Variovorax sp. SRS16 TaxID=282217 RepID=UPI001316AE26|nr:TrbI/VirB10 family protein [Variovorax sp. SRS16]VTU46200.1 Type IV secretion system protein virB10 [Variovorax sp. SRS16]
MSTSDRMSPDASPGQVSKAAGTRRVNSIPVYIACGVVGMFLLVMALVAMDRAQQQDQPVESNEKAGSSSMFAKEIAGDRTDGVVPASALDVPPMPANAAEAPPAQLGQAPVVPPLQPMEQQFPQTGMGTRNDELAERTAEERRQQLEAAMKAKTGVQYLPKRGAHGMPNDRSSLTPASSTEEELARLAALRQQADSANAGDPIAAYKARVAALQASGIGAGSAGAAGSLSSAGAAPSNDIAQFGSGSGSGSQDRWKLNSSPERPRTKYELRAGFVIPATLISGINSELPGQIVAQVSQNVFDTPTGKYLLIPQGARLVGSYANNVIYGQSRVLVAWQRIVFPDGKAMDIGAMPGADSAGYAGFNDQVNNHYVRIFSSALLMSGVIAGVTYSQGSSGTTTPNSAPTAASVLSQALGQELGQVTSQMISKNLNIAPTLEIRPGYRFNVVAVKDLTFTRPYRSFDY